MLKLFNGISIHLKINKYCVYDTHVGQICISHADTFIYIHTQKHIQTYIHTHTHIYYEVQTFTHDENYSNLLCPVIF